MVTLSAGSGETGLEKPSRDVQGTSLRLAYLRGFSDIPNAKTIAILADTEAASNHDQLPERENRAMVTYAEARYKALDALLMRSEVKQVVEFAAGLSPRGMNNPQWNYVHTDQDERSLKQIKDITANILSGRPQAKPHFVKLDAITGEGIEGVMASLEEGEIGIVHEGFFRYYPNPTKEKIGGIAKIFLERYGGIYATPDVFTRQRMKLFKMIRPGIEESWRRTSERLNRDLFSFLFKDNAEAMEMYARLGLVPEIYKIGDLVENLSTIPILFKDDPDMAKLVEKTIKEFEIWKMTLRK